MKSAEIAAEIEALGQKENDVIARLDQMVLASQPEIVALASPWIDAEVRSSVADNTAVVEKLGQEGLAKLKIDVRALHDALPSIVEKLATNRKAWRHYNMPEDAAELYHLRDTGGPEDLFRDTVSHVGKILHQYGLGGGASKMNHQSSWQAIGQGHYRYKYSVGLAFDASKSPALSGYKAGLDELMKIKSALQRKRDELKRTRALEAFESA